VSYCLIVGEAVVSCLKKPPEFYAELLFLFKRLLSVIDKMIAETPEPWKSNFVFINSI
jgi:hypothetical protein